MGEVASDGRAAGRGAAGLIAVMLLALGLRALGFETVFQGGDVYFPPADAQYHLRRAFYSFQGFPAVLLFDSYINYPGGASVPWPPLYDLLVAAVARVLASDLRGFEIVAAWLPPVCATLAVAAVHATARSLGGRAIALPAAIAFASLPIQIHYSGVGQADHHAAVGAIGAWLLYVCVRLVDPELTRGRARRLGAGLFCAELAMLLTWHGSLLYLGIANGLLLLAAVRSGNRALPLAQAGAAGAASCVLIPLLLTWPEPLGGPFSSIAVSWLHVTAMICAAAVATWSWLGNSWRSHLGVAGRGAWVTLGGVALAVPVLLQPTVQQGLAAALGFLTLSDGAGLATSEQTALFAFFGRTAAPQPLLVWGGLAYLLPLAPLGPWLRMRRATTPAERLGCLLLSLWVAVFAALAISQLRYGNDCAAGAAIALAMGVEEIFHRLRRLVAPAGGARLQKALVAIAWAALLSPAIWLVLLPLAGGSWAAWRGDPERLAAVQRAIPATLARFLDEVRLATPETSGYLASELETPEYGIVAHPNLGHAIQYRARRATGADPFWAYIGERNWAHTRAFLQARTQAGALRAAEALRARYVITLPTLDPAFVYAQLHTHDGVAFGIGAAHRPSLTRFRLIAESVGDGHSMLAARRPDPPGSSAYKLFEVVAGAAIEVRSEPGSPVSVSARIVSSTGRAFEYRTGAIADADGVAHLRVPYASRGGGAVRARGPYRIRASGGEYALDVPESAVISGATLRLDARGSS